MMTPVAQSFDSYGLHSAAAAGDDDGVRYALRTGADVNALSAGGKTALMCAIAGENWQSLDPSDASFMTSDRVATIRTILNHPKISLLSLNAPHPSMNGVVPLGMTAWLNMPRVVRLLLEESADAVSVDAMDSHGATALMYAARDGNLEVVQILLSHGARPDFRDSNYRTSVQFSLPHPPILWMCEAVLRRHRWRESRSADRPQHSLPEHILRLAAHALPSSDTLEPPPASIFNMEATSRSLTTLISSIRSGDLDFIHSLLFSPALPPSSPSGLYPMSVPVLINVPDSRGWSLIHHAMSVPQPSVDILDSLYCAGADMALFTTREQWTPLHVLARFASVKPGRQDEAIALYQLVVHLIRDLRSPLSARDSNDETCIHIAAEHGQCLDLLTYLLDCDKSGTVRQLQNSRGLTPIQVAKPEFIAAFGPNAGILQLITSGRSGLGSNDSLSSLATLSESTDQSFSSDAPTASFPSNVDIALLSQSLITNLRLSSPDGRHVNAPSHLHHLENLLSESRQHQQTVVRYFLDKIQEAERELQSLKKNADQIDSCRGMVADAAGQKLERLGIQAIPLKVYHRGSEDSQSTAVSQDSRNFYPSPISDAGPSPRLRINTKMGTLTGRPSVPTFATLFGQSDSPTSYLSPSSGKGESPLDGHEKKRFRDIRLLGRVSTPDLRQSKADSPKKTKKGQEKHKDWEYEKGERNVSGTTRFKAWLKKMVVPSYNSEPAEQTESTAQKQERCLLPSIHVYTPEDVEPCDFAIDTALRTSMIVLDAVDRDLCNIHLSINSAEQFIAMANHSITKAEKAMKRAFKKRQQMINKLRSSKPGTQWLEGDLDLEGSSGLLGFGNKHIHLRPSIASMSSIQSSHSSIASAAATVTEHDDEDTRVIRRLLLRKIEAQTSGAWEDLEKALSWLRIVKEVVRGVKRRAYL